MSVAELGWRALGPGATPEAKVEATWRAVRPNRPCRCTGPCQHGRQRCTEEAAVPGGWEECGQPVYHYDRYPGGMFDVTLWEDVYVCSFCWRS